MPIRYTTEDTRSEEQVSMGALVDGLVSTKIDGFPVTRSDSL
jgi:hypothetical protein